MDAKDWQLQIACGNATDIGENTWRTHVRYLQTIADVIVVSIPNYTEVHQEEVKGWPKMWSCLIWLSVWCFRSSVFGMLHSFSHGQGILWRSLCSFRASLISVARIRTNFYGSLCQPIALL